MNREAAGRKPSIAERRARRAAVDDPQLVLDAALRFLEVRSRSVAEVRRRLRDAGYRADLIEGAIERLLSLGMLDDAAFAEAWVESRDRAHPRGAHALRQELRRKGIEQATIEAALGSRVAPVGGGDDEATPDEAAAERLLQRHARALERIEDERLRRQRAYAILARNGFDPGVAQDVARRFAGRLDADAAEDGA